MMNRELRKKIDKDFKKGKKVENHFIKLAIEKEGFFCQGSSTKQDVEEHWDVQLIKDGKGGYVDVKSIKKVAKDGFTWIEFKNVHGDIGWLLAPKLDAVVFEKEDRFDFVYIDKLRNLMENKMENNPMTFFKKPDDISIMTYSYYNRMESNNENTVRKDLVVLTPLSDIDKLVHKSIYK